MKRKVKFGYVDLPSQTFREKSGIGYDEPIEATKHLTVGEITKQLDDLIEMRNALAGIEDDALLEIAFDKFLKVQYSIIEPLSPILDRLANVGAFLLKYHQNVPSGQDEELIDLSLWSESGYQIVRGYTIYGTKLDTVSDPAPDLIPGFDSNIVPE